MTLRIPIAQAAAFALLLSFALCVSAGPGQADKATPSPPEHAMGTRLKVKGIPNFGEITPNLHRGAQPSPEGLEALKNLGVNLVVDMRGGAEQGRRGCGHKTWDAIHFDSLALPVSEG